jgi:hypothetical protein
MSVALIAGFDVGLEMDGVLNVDVPSPRAGHGRSSVGGIDHLPPLPPPPFSLVDEVGQGPSPCLSRP